MDKQCGACGKTHVKCGFCGCCYVCHDPKASFDRPTCERYVNEKEQAKEAVR